MSYPLIIIVSIRKSKKNFNVLYVFVVHFISCTELKTLAQAYSQFTLREFFTPVFPGGFR